MAAVMANCIKRSNAINGYSAKLTYRESVVFPNFFAGTYVQHITYKPVLT